MHTVATPTTHFEAHGGAALLHSLHGILYLENAALWAPGGVVLIILQQAGVEKPGRESGGKRDGWWQPACSRRCDRMKDAAVCFHGLKGVVEGAITRPQQLA